MIDATSPSMTKQQVLGLSNLALAHLGDTVYDLLVRTWLIQHGNATAGQLHKAAVAYVSAPAQAIAVTRISGHLTEEEFAVFRRGKNARVGNIPQGATHAEYHAATGLEALFGYLYLSGETARIHVLFAHAIGEA